MASVPTDPDKLERMKKRMAKESAAHASQKYRERNRKEYNEKARARMAQFVHECMSLCHTDLMKTRYRKRRTLTEEQIENRKQKARARYERNRIFILEKAKKKRIQQYIDRHGTDGFKESYRPRTVVPEHLLSLKKRDPAQFDTEKFKWKKKVLTDQYFARKRSKATGTRH